jgi:hypothetical protein
VRALEGDVQCGALVTKIIEPRVVVAAFTIASNCNSFAPVKAASARAPGMLLRRPRKLTPHQRREAIARRSTVIKTSRAAATQRSAIL